MALLRAVRLPSAIIRRLSDRKKADLQRHAPCVRRSAAPPTAAPSPRPHAEDRDKEPRSDDPSRPSGDGGGCGGGPDRVTRRLAAAEDARRLDYEREVAARRWMQEPLPAAYRLPGAGRWLSAREAAGAGRCRSGSAPPPRPAPLVPTGSCLAGRDPRPDTCEGRPNTSLKVDRKPVSSSMTPGRLVDSGGLERATPTTRVVETLNRGGFAAAGHRESEGPRAAPSLMERLQRRAGRDTTEIEHRRLHTRPPAVSRPSRCDAADGGLEAALRERELLKEAGRGRAVAGPEPVGRTSAGGGLALRIPPSAGGVRVRVSLDFDRDPEGYCEPSTSPGGPRSSSSPSATGSDSWLPIKLLQRKISNGLSGDDRKPNEQSERRPASPATSEPRRVPQQSHTPPR